MKHALITGAAGFIGHRLALRLLAQGVSVVGFDNLSRKGAEYNLSTLESLGNQGFKFLKGDITKAADFIELEKTNTFDAIFHLAGQVAVTSSYADVNKDFLENALGTVNVLEFAKRNCPDAFLLYSSTNKVYGHLKVEEPVGVSCKLDPYTPYGVSKGVGDLYFREYGRGELGLTTCVLRQSCIYGPGQIGVEDQGWLAWFAIANLKNLPVTIYGTGRQVRDLLFVEDLVSLYIECCQKRVRGQFPVGGGAQNSMSISQAIELIPQLTNKAYSATHYGPQRPGDQDYFVSDNSWALEEGLAWKPETSLSVGLPEMIRWMKQNNIAERF
jgi:CDP-paratose 2-epimerase